MPTVTKSFQSTGPASPATETSAPSTGQLSPQLTLFAEAFPASPTPWLDDGRHLTTTATSGPKSCDAFAQLGPDGSWVKTCQGFSQVTLDGSLEVFSGTWPRAGSMSNGIVYQHPPLVPLTAGTASGLWPTPGAQDGFQRLAGGHTLTLRDQVATPAMWPTPTARDWKDGPASSCANVPANGLLGRVVHQNSQDTSGSLNPTWVEWLMGYPLGWTDCEDSATPSSRKSRNGSRRVLATEK